METAVIWCKFLMSHTSKFIHSLEMVFAQLIHTPADPNSLRDSAASKRSLVDGHDDESNLRVWATLASFCIFFVGEMKRSLVRHLFPASVWLLEVPSNHMSPWQSGQSQAYSLEPSRWKHGWLTFSSREQWETRQRPLQGLRINHSCLLSSISGVRLHLSSYNPTSAYRVSS